MPAAHPRRILNSLLFLLITGSRWRDLPQGPRWASRSSAHRRLAARHLDGTLNALKDRLLGSAQADGMIRWNSGAFDGIFPLVNEAAVKSDMDMQGKGILIHFVVDADEIPLSAASTPANADERKQVPRLRK